MNVVTITSAVTIGLLSLALNVNTGVAQAPIKSKKEQSQEQLNEWVEQLAKKENCGKGIIDTNGKRSAGDLCFQDATFKHFSEKHNETNQRRLAVAMIEDDYSAWKNWRCSVITDTKRCPQYTWGKGIGLPPTS